MVQPEHSLLSRRAACIDALKLRIGEFRGRGIENDLRIGQPDDAIGEAAGIFELMQRNDGGDAVFLADVAQQSENTDRSGRVETGYRLIGQNDRRLLR